MTFTLATLPGDRVTILCTVCRTEFPFVAGDRLGMYRFKRDHPAVCRRPRPAGGAA